jgi:hypothetical protein
MPNHAWPIFLAIVLVAGVGEAGADVVILKSGEMVQTQKAWKENGEVLYLQGGRVVRIDAGEVERLIGSPVPPEGKSPPDAPFPPDAPRAGQALPPPSPTDDDIGYLDLKWGQPLALFEGLIGVATDPAYGGVQQYVKKQGNQHFGRAGVDNIVYGFWRDRLYTIVVQTSNFLDFRDLKAEVFRRYGAGIQNRADVEKYYWTDKGSDRLLSYDYDSDRGFLWMRSRALHEKVRVHDTD